jgi:predicted ArsR family transcriptional regulator
MSDSRDKILDALRLRGAMDVNELAVAVEIGALSIRHHLAKLQAQGLIETKESRVGVGRPKQLYSLSAAGNEKFPTRYLKFTDRLLDEIKSSMPAKVVQSIFSAMAQEITVRNADKFKGKSLEKKLGALVEMLGEEGFVAKWNKAGSAYELTEYNCPYLVIGRRHPEVCTIDQTLISNVMELPVQKSSCLLNGDQHCVFVIGEPKTTKANKVKK